MNTSLAALALRGLLALMLASSVGSIFADDSKHPAVAAPGPDMREPFYRLALSDIAKMLNQDERVLGDKITGLRFDSPYVLQIFVSDSYKGSDDEQSVELDFGKKSGWQIKLIDFPNYRSKPNKAPAVIRRARSPVKIQRDWWFLEIMRVLHHTPKIDPQCKIGGLIIAPDFLDVYLTTDYRPLSGSGQHTTMNYDEKAGWIVGGVSSFDQ